jgi:hypothetical protein
LLLLKLQSRGGRVEDHPSKPGSEKTNPDRDAKSPSGIAAAAVRGAMQSRHERGDPLHAADRQAQQDDDQEWRRAGGKSPE